jgi:hypothetical protein
MVPSVSDETPFLTGVMFFEGIDTAASVQIKTRIYMENQPEAQVAGGATGNAIRVFAQPSPLYDRRALEHVALIAQASTHCYEAADNDFSGVLSKVWDVLKTVGSSVTAGLDIASGLGVPFAGTGAQIGHLLGF